MQKPKKNVELQYEAEMMNIKLPHNLKYFAEHLFKGYQIDKDSKRKTSSCPYKNLKENGKEFPNSQNVNNKVNYQLIDFKGKRNIEAGFLLNKVRKTGYIIKNKKEDFHNMSKNHFQDYSGNSYIENTSKNNPLESDDQTTKIQHLLLNLNTSKVRNKNIWQNYKTNKDNKMMSIKELRAASIKGFKRMKAQKEQEFNIMVKDANKEVMKLEKKLDELFENNKKVFLDAKAGLNI
jgi:hypothetical protein